MAVFAIMHVAITRQIDSMAYDEARTLADEYRTGGLGELGDAIAERESSTSPSRMLYAVFAPNGRRIFGTFHVRRPDLGAQDVDFVDPREGPDHARAIAVDLSPGKRLIVAVDSDWLERFERVLLDVFAAAFVGAFLLGFGGALILGSYLERRLRSISRSAEAIIGGDIRQRMPISARHDEFDQLAATLNRMLDRVEGLLVNLRQVSSDVAHDLRTPLTRLRTRLEQGARDYADGRAPGAVIDDAIKRVDDVLGLFGAMLRIAEVESGETRRFFNPVDLSALLTELAESFAPSFEDKGRALSWSIDQGIVLDGDRELLAQAFINLLENAERHTPPGTAVRLSLAARGAFACARVVDNGPGVPDADLPRVTKRFARLESSRKTAGFGLGLSLVDAVVELHRGRLVLSSAAPGLCATIELPLSDSLLAGRSQQKASE